jgi:hypothetical protein
VFLGPKKPNYRDSSFTPAPVFLHSVRSVAIFLNWLYMSLMKPHQNVTIGSEHCRAGHVQAQSAVLNRRSDCHSEYQDSPAQRIQFRNQCLGVSSKNEVEASRAFFIIARR